MTHIDLNCDMGESFGAYTIGDDEAMLAIVSSANVACGFHGGDPMVIHRTIEKAASNKVQVGAHPGFNDLFGFGRRAIRGERPADIEKQLIYQIGAVRALGEAIGWPIRHVKTHGAMGNMAAEESDLANTVARAIRAVDRDLIFVVMPGMETEKAAERHGLRPAREIYADRAYGENGNLAPRSLEGAVIHDPQIVAERILHMVEDQAVTTMGGKRIPVRIDTVCVHGDTPGAVRIAGVLKERLQAAGIGLRPMAELVT